MDAAIRQTWTRRFLGGRARALPVWVAVGIAILAIWPTWTALVTLWQESADYAHGFLVAPIALAWLYWASLRLPTPTPRISWPAVGLLCAALLAWLVAYKANSAGGQQLVAPIILWLAVWLACGTAVASAVVAPVAYIYFAIPVWELFLPTLQNMTVLASENGMRLLGIPVSIDGTHVTIPEGRFRVEEGCSGKRFLVVSLAVAGFIVAVERIRWRRALAFLAVTAALAIVTNWLRVIIIIYAGHKTNMTHYLVAVEHISFGWLLYIVLFVVIYFVGTRVFSHAPAPPSSNGEAAAEPIYSWTAAPMIVAAAILCVPLFAVMYVNYVRSPADGAALSLPAGAGSWEGAGPAVDTGWNPVFPEASATARGSYRSSAGTVEVFTARYETQRQGAELINFSNSLLGEGWQAYDHGSLTEEHASPLVSDIRTIRGHTGGTVRILVSYVYRVGPVVTSSDAVAQLSYGLLSWNQERPATVVAAAMRCVHMCTTERETLTAFWSEFGAKLIDDAHPTPRKL